MEYREIMRYDKVPPHKVTRDPMEDRFGLSPELKEYMNQEEERRLNEEYRDAVRVLEELRESMSGEHVS
jgi:hypothetical protein